ncbi:hypothetical protein ACOI1C_12740 [Bacillus sp. DJP31]|uniref:hypothetical protein n=1 Tax=Bacillus sp. DJP31 TaxID=3409789 RepID=UPI003BB7CEC2
MLDYGWLNVGSLVLGLIAWIIPIFRFTRNKKDKNNETTLLFLSLSVCAISLCFQVFYTYHLVMIKDWSALQDTMYAVAIAATVLLIVTILLNGMTLIAYRRK